MTVTVGDIARHRPLGVSLLTAGYENAGVNWAHSSDLDDPTPFLEPGQMLLTTGRQFALFQGLDDYAAYIARLAVAGVVALGFGTEVVRGGTPVELLEACENAGIALIEVPYATPFIAVSKFIADRLAAETRRQLERALAAQDAISRAVLGSGGLAAAVRSASGALECRIAVLDPDGVVLEGRAPPWLRDRAVELVRRGARARDHGESDAGFWMAQTLGRSRSLLGGIVMLRPYATTAGEASVITTLAALTELALEHSEDERLGFRPIAQEFLELLRAGRVDSVRQALAYHRMQLPSEPFQVSAVAVAELPPALRDSLERAAASRGGGLFVAERGKQLLVLADGSSQQGLEFRLTQAGVRAGLSSKVGWAELDEALAQASTALAGAPAHQILGFDDLVAGTVFGLLKEPRVSEVANLRLGRLLASDSGRSRLREAVVWLRFNGSWDPAAQALGLHRHTLKRRIAELGTELGLALEAFPGRAELWAILAAVDLAEG